MLSHMLDFLEFIHKIMFSRKLFASSCIPVHPDELWLRTAVLSNLQQDTDVTFPLRTEHQLNHFNPFMNLFHHQK